MIYAVNKRTKEHVKVIDDGAGPFGFDLGWVIVQADDDGWIEWHGGECPLPDKHPVELRFRTGDTTRSRVSGPWSWSHNSNALPIIAYRPIFAADTKPEPPAWDGEGLPPVGCECEVNHLGEWHETTIVGYDAGFPVFNTNWHERYAYASGSDFKFRPIRSEEDKAVEDMIDCMPFDCSDTDSRAMAEFARALYRAGYRKTGGEG